MIERLGKYEIDKRISLDKNLRLAVLETEFLPKHGISYHLNNEDVYRRLSKRKAV